MTICLNDVVYIPICW